MSTRSISWGKGGRCIRLPTLPPSCAVVMKSGNPNFLEPSGSLQACNGTAVPVLQINYTYIQTKVKMWLPHAPWLEPSISTDLQLFQFISTPPPKCCGPTMAMASEFMKFLYHTQRRTQVSRAPLDAWSARYKDLYLTTHNHASGGFRNSLSRRAAADYLLRPRGHWDRHSLFHII